MSRRPPALPRLLASGLLAALPVAADAEPGDAELAGLTYRGIHADPVTLADGRWEGEPFVAGGSSRPRVELVGDFRRSGDLDGDGRDEVVVLLAESSGGSGVFGHLAVVGRGDGGWVNLATAPIGDRVQVRAARVVDRGVELDVVQAGPGDAACCPSQLARRRFELEGDALREVSQEPTGSLGPEVLGGGVWVLTHLSAGERVPAEPTITLELREGRLTGSSGCNLYNAFAEPGAAPGEWSIGPVAGTRRACPEEIMALETRYLEAFQGTTGYGFVNGRLALRGIRDGEPGTLLYELRPAPAAAGEERS